MSIIHLASLPPKLHKVELLAWIAELGGVDVRRLGKLEISGREAVLEVPAGWERRLVKALDGARFGERLIRAWTGRAPADSGQDETHFDRLSRLLEIESKAAARQALERARRLDPAKAEESGNCLLDLVIVDEDPGLG